MASIHLDGVAAGGIAGGPVWLVAGRYSAAFLIRRAVSGEGEIPACAGMTVVGARMAAGEGEIPACAGMTVVGAGMTVDGVGMTAEVNYPTDWKRCPGIRKGGSRR